SGKAAAASSTSVTSNGASGTGPRGGLVHGDRADAELLGPLEDRERRVRVRHAEGLDLPLDDVERVELEPLDAVLLHEAVDLVEHAVLPWADAAVEQHAAGPALTHPLADPERRAPVLQEPEDRQLVIDRHVGRALREQGA